MSVTVGTLQLTGGLGLFLQNRCPRDFAFPLDLIPRGEIPNDFALPQQGLNPWNFALPAYAPPFRDLAPPPPLKKSSYLREYFCFLDAATECASKIWFGNLFEKDLRESEPILTDIFKSWSCLSSLTVLQLRG